MNKRALKSYLNNNKTDNKLLRISCFKDDNKFIISDTYSIIVLNDNYDLIPEDKIDLKRFKDNFENNYEVDYTFMNKLEDNEDMYEPITDKYGINIKLFKRIDNVIKGNTYAVLKSVKADDYVPFIIRLENTKTKELGYMLPMKTF